MKGFKIIVAVDQKDGIAKNGKIPWRCEEDMRFFKQITTEHGPNVVIMGRKTWDSLPKKFRPLPNRMNIVITSSTNSVTEIHQKLLVATSFQQALDRARETNPENIFVIGGKQVYEEALKHPDCEGGLVTKIVGDHGCDMFFEWQKQFSSFETDWFCDGPFYLEHGETSVFKVVKRK